MNMAPNPAFAATVGNSRGPTVATQQSGSVLTFKHFVGVLELTP